MNITPISMTKVNSIQSSRQNKAQNVNNTLNDTLSFTARYNKKGNGFTRSIAALLAALGIVSAGAPAAKALTLPPQTGYVETMPLPGPTIVQDEVVIDKSGNIDVSVYNTKPYEPAQVPFEERLDEIIPESNRLGDYEDAIIAQMKQCANIALLMKEASKARNAANKAADNAKLLQENLNIASNKDEVTNAINALNSRASEANGYASAVEDEAYDISEDMAQRSKMLEGIKSSDTPINPFFRLVYPNIDTFEDIFGYGDYMRDYVYSLIPNYDTMPKNKRDVLLLAEAARVRVEAQDEEKRAKKLESIAEQLSHSYNCEHVGSKDLVDDMVSKTAASRKAAEKLNTVATNLEGIVDGSFKLSSPPPVNVPSSYDDETDYTTEVIIGDGSNEKDEGEPKPIEKPYPIPPKEVPPIGCSEEDIFGKKPVPSEPTLPPEPEKLPIGCTFEDIFGRPEPSKPTLPPEPEKLPIGCTFEDIMGMTYEEFMGRQKVEVEE